MYELRVEGATQVAAQLAAASAYARGGQMALAQEFAARGVATVRGHATGRPGPNVITGHYLTTIESRLESGAEGWTAVIYSNAPQARRLELGFYGADSLGRVYAQPPYSHFRPAYDELYPQYVRAQVAFAGMVAAIGNGGGAGAAGAGRGVLGRIAGVFRR